VRRKFDYLFTILYQFNRDKGKDRNGRDKCIFSQENAPSASAARLLVLEVVSIDPHDRREAARYVPLTYEQPSLDPDHA
jgi:hypothetical protein